MATKTVDIKLSFEQYDAVPDHKRWQSFRSNLLAHGGQADDHGWSFTDVFLGLDDGGRNGAALPAAPGGNADERAQIRLRRKRLKGAATYLTAHISNVLVDR